MESHLLQMRGLKHDVSIAILITGLVASFTDAWIETAISSGSVMLSIVASFTDAWIETFIFETK